ncbi:alpha/beta fold hydrolase [Bowmanella denitrificans]|uniref:alpha/beta fold hydrolase n=1 Tax=Bowmanella denitrificans TaxID=366582 RepID=UPI000C9CBE47|nr:alpha/beta fold hydrolase [Bowmanella denitrificans]
MNLNYQISGQGQPLVLLHGLFGSLENLGGIRRELEDQYQIIAVDLPDHGRSAHSQTFSYQAYSDQILALCKQLGLEQVILLGHSMGGKVAMTIALHHPALVSRLIVADIAPVAYNDRHSQVFAGLNAVNLPNLTDRRQADAQMATHINEAGVRQFLLKSLTYEQDTWQWRFNLALLQQCYGDIIDWPFKGLSYNGPTLFIKGGRSDYLQAAYRDTIAAQFPSSQGRIIADVGHWLHAEKPAAFGKIVRDFIRTDETH